MDVLMDAEDVCHGDLVLGRLSRVRHVPLTVVGHLGYSGSG